MYHRLKMCCCRTRKVHVVRSRGTNMYVTESRYVSLSGQGDASGQRMVGEYTYIVCRRG
jgi:hypothetical protein